MSKTKMFGLTVNEMNLICDSTHHLKHDLSCVNWKDVFIADLEVANDLKNFEEKWGVKLKSITRKLKKISEVELLLLILEVMYTVDDCGSGYKSLNIIPPHQKMMKILNQSKS
jgi:hypothetical protein